MLRRIWDWIMGHLTWLIGGTLALIVAYYLFFSRSSGQASPTTVSFPSPGPSGGGGGGGTVATPTTDTTTPTPTPTLASWISSAEAGITTGQAPAWGELLNWLNGTQTTVSQQAANLWQTLVASNGTPPGWSGRIPTVTAPPANPPPAPAPPGLDLTVTNLQNVLNQIWGQFAGEAGSGVDLGSAYSQDWITYLSQKFALPRDVATNVYGQIINNPDYFTASRNSAGSRQWDYQKILNAINGQVANTTKTTQDILQATTYNPGKLATKGPLAV